MDAVPITLPAAPATPRRTPLPLLAAVVPIAAGAAMWLVTGMVQTLWFAALGPVMLVASLADAARARRRDRRHHEAQAEIEWSAAEEELRHRHDDERAALRRLHPDAASCLREQPLRDARMPDARTEITVGSGAVPSAVGCSGGDDPRARAFRERCALLDDAPLVVPIGRGVFLRGPRPIIDAAMRALALQMCLRFGPTTLSLVGSALDGAGLDALPHASRPRQSTFRIGVVAVGAERIEADATIWLGGPDDEPPEGVTTVIDVVDPSSATLRTPQTVRPLAVEFLSLAQARTAATACAERREEADAVPARVDLSDLQQNRVAGLSAAIGRGVGGDVVLDLVEDGPHAIVTGMTGAGKSELLVSWVSAIASRVGPDRVSFVLADFKGGTAFEPLRALRHVAAVITDLDEEGSRRGVASLTAELRRREAVLAEAGARDVSEVDMPRLVIVIDEFAALVQEHPDLAAVFTDVAARGRALGMHLVLGTQRAAGVVRDALAANCPLRISLRVAEGADSRAVLGSDAAADLAGGPEGRGLALVRRATDREPVLMRVALTGAADLRRIGMRWADEPAPPGPWLPALPRRIDLADLADGRDGGAERASRVVVLGLADDPQHQSQPREVLRPGRDRGLVVLGAPGSGRTTLLRAIAVQRPDACRVPCDAEYALDLLADWVAGVTPPPLVLCDDLDGLHAELPPEYAQEFALRWERVVRATAGTTWVLTAARSSGALSRVFDALPRRALLRMPSRVEHLAAGGDAAGFDRERADGRARIGDRDVQFAWVDRDALPAPAAPVAQPWAPACETTAVVTPGAAGIIAALRASHPEWHVTTPGDAVTEGVERSIVVADADTWQRNWASWQRVRAEGEVLVRAERPADLRQLVGTRELPPYARPHAGRAWSVIGDRPPRRVVLPELLS